MKDALEEVATEEKANSAFALLKNDRLSAAEAAGQKPLPLLPHADDATALPRRARSTSLPGVVRLPAPSANTNTIREGCMPSAMAMPAPSLATRQLKPGHLPHAARMPGPSDVTAALREADVPSALTWAKTL